MKKKNAPTLQRTFDDAAKTYMIRRYIEVYRLIKKPCRRIHVFDRCWADRAKTCTNSVCILYGNNIIYTYNMYIYYMIYITCTRVYFVCDMCAIVSFGATRIKEFFRAADANIGMGGRMNCTDDIGRQVGPSECEKGVKGREFPSGARARGHVILMIYTNAVQKQILSSALSPLPFAPTLMFIHTTYIIGCSVYNR